MPVSENVAKAKERMAAACRRAGRGIEQVELMAVSKTFPPDAIREAYAAGIRLFGESRVQEFAGKIDALRDLVDADWHMIGHLQSNKASKAAGLFGSVDSVDSLRLAEKLNAAAASLAKKLGLLIEIKVGGESAKSGLAPGSKELEQILEAAPGLTNLEIRGLMTVPPYAEDPERARPYFRKLHELRDGIAARKLPAVEMGVLSMGMSHDFEIAVEEGATCVRVGTAIFGERQKE